MHVFTFHFSSSSIEQLGTADSIARLFIESFGECLFLVRLLQGAEVVPHICKIWYYSLEIFGIGYTTGFYPEP